MIAREIGDRRGGNALGNLGNAYADLGEVDTAIPLESGGRSKVPRIVDAVSKGLEEPRSS